jgi:hypothetical protein
MLYACDAVRDDLRQKVVGFPTELHDALRRANATEFGTIYLDPMEGDVRLADYGAYRQTGIPFSLTRHLAGPTTRSEVIFVAGAQPERERPAWAALKAGLASTFITDVEFAWNVLATELPQLRDLSGER